MRNYIRHYAKDGDFERLNLTIVDDEYSYDEADQLIVIRALGDEGVYKLYYEEPDYEELEELEWWGYEDIDYEKPTFIENITDEFDIDYMDGYKVTGKLKRVEHGLVDFVADALREYDGEYVEPVEIGYIWAGGDLEATHVFIDGKSFKNANGDDITRQPETIEL